MGKQVFFVCFVCFCSWVFFGGGGGGLITGDFCPDKDPIVKDYVVRNILNEEGRQPV